MTEAFDHFLDVHGNQRLVLDNEDVGCHLAGDLVARLGEQFGKFLFVEETTDNPTVLDAYDVSADSNLGSPVANVGWSPGAWQAFDTQ